MLIPGAKYPQDILEAQGPEAVEEYIIAEIQNAYRTRVLILTISTLRL